MSDEVYERLIYENDTNQIKLTINIFKGVEYISLRKYYRSFEDEWCHSNEGITFPIDISSTEELFKGMAEIISLAESREVIEEFFGDTIRNIYQ